MGLQGIGSSESAEIGSTSVAWLTQVGGGPAFRLVCLVERSHQFLSTEKFITHIMSDAAITQLLSRLEAVANRLESVEKQLATGGGGSGGASSAPVAAGEVTKAVTDFDNLISTYIDEYVATSAKIDPLVKQQADLVKQAVQAQRDLIYKASQSKKPDATTFANLLKPTSDLMGKIATIRDSNRASKVFGHLSTISEGINALGWVAAVRLPTLPSLIFLFFILLKREETNARL
jgi:hypothetical protein